MVTFSPLLPGTQDPMTGQGENRGGCGRSPCNGCAWPSGEPAVWCFPLAHDFLLAGEATLSHIITAFTCKCLCHLVRDPKLGHLKPCFKLILHL